MLSVESAVLFGQDRVVDPDVTPTVALLTDLWPSRSEPYAGGFVRASLDAVGSAAQFVVLVPRLLARRFHRVVWSDGVQGWQDGWEAPAAPHRLLRYPVARVPRHGDIRAVGSDWALRWAQESPQLVHAHFLHEVGVAGVALARRRGIPVVVTVHGTDGRWLIEGGVQNRHRRRMLAAVRDADRVLVVNREMCDVLEALGVKRAEVLPMGVDETVFRPRERGEARERLGLARDARVVLFAGPPTAAKGFPVLERAVSRLDGVQAYAAGPPPPPGPIPGVGVLSAKMLAMWLNAADVFCLPSTAEGTPVTVSEALASGTPVVATRVGGIPDQLRENGGVLVEPGDDAALARALLSAFARSWDREAIRRASRPYWWSELGPRLADLYRSLLA